MENSKNDHSACVFKYYLFKEGDLKNPRVIPVSSLNLKRIICLEYKNITSKDLKANRMMLMFNALFDSNKELLDAIIMEYKNAHPKSKIDQEKYERVRLVISGHNSEDFNFLDYDETKKNDEDKIERFVPIIYDSDFVRSRYNGLSNRADLIYPRKMLMNIFSPRYTVYKENDYSFDSSLYREIYRILLKKYTDRLKHVNPKLNEDISIKESDTLNVYNLLNSDIIKKLYTRDSYLFISLLAIVAYHLRLHHLYKLINREYDINSTIVSSRMQLQFSSRSISELRYDLEMLYCTKPKSEQILVPLYTEEKVEAYEKPILGKPLEYTPDLERKLALYNEKYLTNYTITDVLACDRLYIDVTENYGRTHKADIDGNK